METIIYGIIGILVLLGSAFLFTYYDSLESKGSQKIAKIRRSGFEIHLNKVGLGEIKPAIPVGDKNFSSKKKHIAFRRGMFAFILYRNTKRKNRITPQVHL